MRVWSHPGYVVPLPERHPFPIAKFSHLRDELVATGVVAAGDVREPREMDWADLLLVHTPRYLDALATGTLSRAEERRLGLPWSPALVRRSRLAVHGTTAAMLAALHDGVAGNLAGGTHHAMPDGGEGFCVLNDVAVGLQVLRREGWIGRALVVDLDVHQGNGNAAFFGGERAWPAGGVYTFSMHGARNFPFRKPPSTRDVALNDGTGDAAYLTLLSRHLPEVLAEARPDLVVYLAGVDVVAGDRFGRLALTPDGLAARDRLVCATVRDTGIPLCLLLSGGYARVSPTPGSATDALATARLHATVFAQARQVYELAPVAA